MLTNLIKNSGISFNQDGNENLQINQISAKSGRVEINNLNDISFTKVNSFKSELEKERYKNLTQENSLMNNDKNLNKNKELPFLLIPYNTNMLNRVNKSMKRGITEIKYVNNNDYNYNFKDVEIIESIIDPIVGFDSIVSFHNFMEILQDQNRLESFNTQLNDLAIKSRLKLGTIDNFSFNFLNERPVTNGTSSDEYLSNDYDTIRLLIKFVIDDPNYIICHKNIDGVGIIVYNSDNRSFGSIKRVSLILKDNFIEVPEYSVKIILKQNPENIQVNDNLI
jgi:hypothetical protein